MTELLSVISLIFFVFGLIQIPVMVFMKPEVTNYWASIQSGVGEVDLNAQTLFVMLLLSFISAIVRELLLEVEKRKRRRS